MHMSMLLASNPLRKSDPPRARRQADMKSEPRMAEDGRLWTPGAVDFFRTVNEQVRFVLTCSY